MPTIHKEASVPYTPEQMYQLVDDVKKYPEFVPWCVAGEEFERTEDTVRAALTFAGSGLRKSFTTLNRLHPPSMMEINLVDGPFEQLEGFWRFEDQNGRCRVVLDLEFEFSSRLLALMFGPIFHQVAVTLVDCFIKRARQVYG